jgi:putative transposase
MKNKRYTTEEKIRILRQVDNGKSVAEVCREHNLSQVSFYRWKKQFGQMEVNEAKRMKELERENSEPGSPWQLSSSEIEPPKENPKGEA